MPFVRQRDGTNQDETTQSAAGSVRVRLELLRCDVCGTTETTRAHFLAFDNGRWQVDLCRLHLQETEAVITGLASTGEPIIVRRRDEAESEWTYLESLGFQRHRGRKTAAEREALAARSQIAPLPAT